MHCFPPRPPRLPYTEKLKAMSDSTVSTQKLKEKGEEVSTRLDSTEKLLKEKSDSSEFKLRAIDRVIRRERREEKGRFRTWFNSVRTRLQHGPLTQCAIKVSCVPAEFVKDPKVLRAIAQAPNQDMLGTETVNAILHSAWKRVRWYNQVLIILQAAYGDLTIISPTMI